MKMFTLLIGLTLMSGSYAEEKNKELKHEKGEFLKKELSLTDEQLEKVKAIRNSSKTEMKNNKEQFKKLKDDFHAAMKNPASSKEELTTKFEAFQKARDEFQRKRFSHMLKMREILNPEQLAKFHEMKKKHHGEGRKNKDRGSKRDKSL